MAFMFVPSCPKCGSTSNTRKDDTYECRACGHKWDRPMFYWQQVVDDEKTKS